MAEPLARILIADDEEAICFCLTRAVARRGYVARVAADGRTAVDLVRRHAGRVGAAFLDVRTPRLDGLSALAAIRAIDPRLPCCVMTAFHGDRDVRRSLAGVDIDVLRKPFDLKDFEALLDRLMARDAAVRR